MTLQKSRRFTVLLALIGVLSLLAGCSSSDGTPPPPGTTPPGGLCEVLRLGKAVGEPGEYIPVTGLPAGSQLSAQVTVAGASEPAQTLVVEEPGAVPGRTVLIVPVHPTTPFAGGTTELAFTDGSQTCPSQPFEIAALPDPNAPAVKGTLKRQVVLTQATLDAQARALGVDPTSLKGDIATLPPEALSLGLAQFFIDHPENPNSLMALATRGSVLQEDGSYETFDRGLMDALAYQFAFSETLQGDDVQTAAVGSGCIGREALSSPQQLSDCMNRTPQLQELYDALALQAQIITYALVPLVIAFPTLGVPALFIGYAYFFINSVVLIEVQGSPSALAKLEFTATPDTLLNQTQSGLWSNVLVTVADGEPLDIAELLKGMIDAADFSPLVPALGVGFDLYVSNVLGLFKTTFEDDLNKFNIPYSTFGSVDITAYTESYSPSVASGSEVQIVSAERRVYAPSVPFRDGRADLVLAVNEGYFNTSPVQGARQITVGQPTEEDEPFTITTVEAAPVPWNGRGDVEISWAGEGVAFPVTLEMSVANCSFTECNLTGGTFESRANPLIFAIECTTNDPNPTPSTVAVTMSLEDSTGKRTPSKNTSFQCGTAGNTRVYPNDSSRNGEIRSVPF